MGRQLVQRFGQQHRQTEQPGLTLSLIARQFSTQRFDLGFRTRDLGFITAPGIAQALGERGGLRLQF